MRESQDDVVSRLIIEGSYSLILTKIFINLDQQTIVDCGKVCHLWRQFLITNITRNVHFKKYTDEKQNIKWRRWKTTLCRPKLDGLMTKLSDKVCQFYSDDDSQLLVLGKSYSGVGRRLVLCRDNYRQFILLSHTEEVASALVSPGLVVASTTSSCLLVWRWRGREVSSLGEGERYSLDTGLQLRLQADLLYILSREGNILVFSLTLRRVTRQILPAQSPRFLTFQIERGLLAGGSTDRHLYLLSLAENKVVHKLRSGGSGWCLALSRPLLVSGGEGLVNVYHVRLGHLLHRLCPGPSPARLSCLQVWSGLIIAGDVRGNVLKWDLREEVVGEAVTLHTMTEAVRGLQLTSNTLTALAFDGDCLVWNFW